MSDANDERCYFVNDNLVAHCGHRSMMMTMMKLLSISFLIDWLVGYFTEKSQKRYSRVDGRKTTTTSDEDGIEEIWEMIHHTYTPYTEKNTGQTLSWKLKKKMIIIHSFRINWYSTTKKRFKSNNEMLIGQSRKKNNQLFLEYLLFWYPLRIRDDYLNSTTEGKKSIIKIHDDDDDVSNRNGNKNPKFEEKNRSVFHCMT